MKSRLHRRAMLQWFVGAGLALPLLPAEPLADEPGEETRDLEAFLEVFLRHLFPHPGLDPAAYGEVAVALTGMLEADSGLHALIADGRRELAGENPLPWLKLSPEAQSARLHEHVGDAFFQALRALGGLVFYSTPAVWKLLGYEGPSYEKGGYLLRGFDDIDWLPESAHGH